MAFERRNLSDGFGVKAAVTDGLEVIIFDTPADFSDWLFEVGDIGRWQWVSP